MSGKRRVVRGKRSGNIIGGKSAERYTVPVARAQSDPGPEVMEVYWHPNRPGVELPPEDFARKLREAHVDLACCRAPARAPLGMAPAWVFWYRKGSITHRLSPGWKFLFSWRDANGVPQPLDERCFAILYAASAMRWGNGKQYFDRAVTQVEADRKAIREKDFQNHRKAKQREFLQTHRISNLGDGSRSALHHDGSIVPSKGEIAWREQRRRRMMPSEQLAAEDDAKDKARYVESELGKLKLQ